jgi:NAD binding domain of 6-phosphogluconate dehydrogenase/NAD-binding of NADP-dependent 3-hydroxyisobutyrate dehydrogenase
MTTTGNTVAVIGLGVMVAPMADVVLTVLPDTPDVDLAVTGEDGVFADAKADALRIDSSTIRPDASVRLASIRRDNGIRALDAPLSGGEIGAINGTLSVMVGGDAADFEAAKPVLNAVGSTIVHVGPSGAGQVVKTANQLLVAGTLGLVAEALMFLDAQGVDAEAAIKVLADGLASSRIPELKAANIVARHYAPEIPGRPSPQGPRNRHRGCPGRRGRHPARSDGSPADGCVAGSGERWPGPQRAAHAHRDAVRPSAGVKGNRAGGQRSRRDRNAIRTLQPRMKPSGTTAICRSSAHFPREMEERND